MILIRKTCMQKASEPGRRISFLAILRPQLLPIRASKLCNILQPVYVYHAACLLRAIRHKLGTCFTFLVWITTKVPLEVIAGDSLIRVWPAAPQADLVHDSGFRHLAWCRCRIDGKRFKTNKVDAVLEPLTIGCKETSIYSKGCLRLTLRNSSWRLFTYLDGAHYINTG